MVLPISAVKSFIVTHPGKTSSFTETMAKLSSSLTSSCLTFLVLISFNPITKVASFPTGAPNGTCATLMPGHGHPAQTSPSPYKLALDTTSVKPGEKIKLTISGKPGLKGFLAQGRKHSGTGDTTPHGIFTSGGPDSKTITCHHDHASITHTNNDVKNSISVTWTAPQEKGKYQIL